jgi:ABC-2 type transport system ATP-binding protein
MIQTQDLGKQFGDFWAVDGINLEVKAGEILALLGQNGAGKTTTIRMLTSILPPTRGHARVGGFDVVQQAVQARGVVGVLTEQHGLYLRMTGMEYLDFFGKVYSMDKNPRSRRINELLEYFILNQVARQPIGTYSKGMRQKLALARALLHQPPALLLDEPTSAMDPESALLARNSISRLKTEKRAVIICTHNLVEAEMLADRIAIIHRGRLIAQGTSAELKRDLLGPEEYRVRFRGSLPGDSLRLPEKVELMGVEENIIRLRIDDPQETNPILITTLIKQGINLITIEECSRSLEDAYLRAIKKVVHA